MSRFGCWLTVPVLVLALAPAAAQEKLPQPRAATVNGEPILEKSVQRALRPVPKEHQARARQEILNFLVDNLLIEQYLIKQKIDAPKAEVEARMQKIKEEAAKNKQDLAKLLDDLMLTEAELRDQVAADLRWETYVKARANDQAVAAFFAANKEWFDGSQVRARHVLVAAAPDADAQTKMAAKTKVMGLKKQIDDQVAKAMALVPGNADTQTKAQARAKALNEAFATATSQSDCPSKKAGGDLGWFFRVGNMVEPFARAAFGLQVDQMSDVVETQFGYHLILVTNRMPGKDVKLSDIKDDVREVMADRFREELLPQLRQTAKVEILQAK
jgi:parvulin-like peptidyl-prolyl isomerase